MDEGVHLKIVTTWKFRVMPQNKMDYLFHKLTTLYNAFIYCNSLLGFGDIANSPSIDSEVTSFGLQQIFCFSHSKSLEYKMLYLFPTFMWTSLIIINII